MENELKLIMPAPSWSRRIKRVERFPSRVNLCHYRRLDYLPQMYYYIIGVRHYQTLK